jgi:hypothetical protein
MSNILAITYDGAPAVTASDTVDDPGGPFAGLLVTATGNLTFLDNRGNAITLTAVAANTIINIAARRVNSSGLTATVRGLIAMPFKPTKAS